MASIEPHHPRIVDPEGVNTSIEPRPLGRTDDDSRAAVAATTGGEPLVDFSGPSNPYIDYQSIDLLLSLQHPRSSGVDEMCFFVMGQVKELLYRGLHYELVNAQMQIRADEIGHAIRMLDRARVFVRYLTDSWDVLATISSEGFEQFRDHLGTASGQLSFMYRHVEFVLGNKNRRLAEAHRNVPHVWPGIRDALESPSLYDDVIALLERRGHRIDTAVLDRDWSEPYRFEPTVAAAWKAVFEASDVDSELRRLGEGLLSIDHQFSVYRWRHFTTVERIIGYKPGTGGSAGVAWLEQVTKHHFFPELWALAE